LVAKPNISAVSYLNTKPFIWGLQHSEVMQKINLTLDIPSVCAQKLITGKADIGLVPVAAIPHLPASTVFTDFCIAADGKVSSVLLVSRMPLEKIESVMLDYQSMTSVSLVKILAHELWKINPEWLPTQQGYEASITNQTAGVIIGDRALMLKDKFNFVYDLADEWKKLTTLPFVFAAWVSTKNMNAHFEDEFSGALQHGVNHINELCDTLQAAYSFDVKRYLTQNINYTFNAQKRQAMQLFLEKLQTYT
jgi:chorismate dehydratase